MNIEEPGGRGQPRRRVTMADVARASDVSRATVSYVLNRAPSHSISAETQELVWETAIRLGYLPSAPARALRSGRSNLVLVFVSGYTVGYVLGRSLHALDAALSELGHSLFIHYHSDQPRSMADLWRVITPGLIIEMGGLPADTRREIKKSGAAIVDLAGQFPHAHAGRMQAEYLIAAGHKHLGFGAPADPALKACARQRLRGVTMACRAAGVPDPVVKVIDSRAGIAKKAVSDWLGLPDPVTAVCAHNDDVALMMMAAMAESRPEPGHLAVIGSDDIPMARLFGLTTVAVDISVLTERQVRLAKRAIVGGPGPASLGSVPDLLSLVVRRTA